jgi:hypothetical protein
MNWGRALILVFLLFVGFMAYLVYKASGTHFDLVSKEYYRDELTYQDKIDGMQRAAAMGRPVFIMEGDKQLSVQLPAEMRGKKISGELWLYCETNAALDLKLPLAEDTALFRRYDLSSHAAGKYLVKLHWQADGLKYDIEQQLNIP